MKKTFFIAVLFITATGSVSAQKVASWLPKDKNPINTVRLLECIYDNQYLQKCDPITPNSSDWEVTVKREGSCDAACSDGSHAVTYYYTFKAKRDLKSAGVAVAFDRYNWSSDNYVMIPSCIYNANRQRIVNRPYATGLDKSDFRNPDLALSSNPIPQLSPEFGAPSKFEILVNNCATPAIAWLERAKKEGNILLTNQGIERNGEIIDHGLIVEESLDRSLSSIIVSAPGVRAKKLEFIGFSTSPDRGIDFKKDEEVVIPIKMIEFSADDAPAILNKFAEVRKDMTGPNAPRNLKPASEIFRIMTKNIDRRYLVKEEWEYYFPEGATWISFGWIGGMMNTYPMLALGDEEHRRRVKSTYDFALSRAQRESGYFHTILGEDGKVFGRDAAAANPELILTRQNADVLYWMVKQFVLLKAQGHGSEIKPEWEDSMNRLAQAFVNTYKQCGAVGNYLNVRTGEVEVYNTTSGAIVVAGLAIASQYYNNPEYLEISKKIAEDYYDNFELVGFTSGGCGDILQNADSETSIAFLTSLNYLYEVTGDKKWLERAENVANLCATWVISYDYILPKTTDLGALDAKMAGTVWASTQNKHGAPGFCTSSADALFRLYRTTKDPKYADLLHDVFHAYAEGIRPNGYITERLQISDSELRGSRGWGDGGNGWTELNGALMCLEVPGLYIRKDDATFFAFDHLDVTMKKCNDKEMVLSLANTTEFDAEVTVLCEDASNVSKPLSPIAFTNWEKILVKAGKTLNYTVKR